MVGFGVFLIVCGVAGFLSNPAGAKTALISGGTFGLLSAFWGFLLWRGLALAWWAAAATTLLLIAAFAWRSWASWAAVAAGEPKVFAAGLITLMFAASVLSLGVLLKRPRHGSA